MIYNVGTLRRCNTAICSLVGIGATHNSLYYTVLRFTSTIYIRQKVLYNKGKDLINSTTVIKY